jgi:hypothetical protein
MASVLNSQSRIVGLLCGTLFVGSCIPRTGRRGGSEGNQSPLKSVTINQPDLAKEMKSSMSDAEKKSVLDSLVYSLEISGVEKDGREDCVDGVSATKFDSGVLPFTSSKFEALRVKKGCNYLVSMKIGAKSEDGKLIKTVYLSSWDSKNPSLLTREELERASPTVRVELFVTNDGKKYWDAESIETPIDADATINAGLAKKFKLKASKEKVEVKPAEPSAPPTGTISFSGSISLVPVEAVTKDMYCAVALNTSFIEKDDGAVSGVKAMFLQEDIDKSFVKIPAGSSSVIELTTFEASTIPPLNKAKSTVVYAYCYAEQEQALARLKSCFDEGADANWPACESSSIAR